MIVKKIFLATLVVFLLGLKPVFSMDTQESNISIEDVNKLRNCLRGEAEFYLITVNLNSDQFEDKKGLISDLQNGVNRNYCTDNSSFVDKSIKINFLDFYKESQLN